MPRLQGLLKLAGVQYGCVSYEQGTKLMSASAFKRLTKSGFLVRMHPRIYRVVGSADSWEQKAFAATLSVPGSALSHQSSARIFGFAYTTSPHIELTVPRGSAERRPGIRVHSSEQLTGWTTSSRRLPVTTVARTLVDLSMYLNERQLGRAVDQACNRKLVKLAEIKHCLDRMITKGRPRITSLRTVLDERNGTDERLETMLERKALAWIREAGLPEPVAQHWLDANGNHYRLDLAYPALRIDFEPDGPHHHQPSVAAYDRKRDTDIALEGWLVIRLPLGMTQGEFIGLVRAAVGQRSAPSTTNMLR